MKLVAEKLRKMREEKGKFEYIIRIAQFYDISLRKLFSQKEDRVKDYLSDLSFHICIPFNFNKSEIFLEIAEYFSEMEKNK